MSAVGWISRPAVDASHRGRQRGGRCPFPARWSAFVAAPAIPLIDSPRTARPAAWHARLPISPSHTSPRRAKAPYATLRRAGRPRCGAGTPSCRRPPPMPSAWARAIRPCWKRRAMVSAEEASLSLKDQVGLRDSSLIQTSPRPSAGASSRGVLPSPRLTASEAAAGLDVALGGLPAGRRATSWRARPSPGTES